MSEPREPSYYEIALTNRQVLVAFVIILGCVLAAFLSGVWTGQRHLLPSSGATTAALSPESSGPAGDEEGLEELRFFEEGKKGDGSNKPDLDPLLADPDPGTTLAEDVSKGKGGNRKDGTAKKKPRRRPRAGGDDAAKPVRAGARQPATEKQASEKPAAPPPPRKAPPPPPPPPPPPSPPPPRPTSTPPAAAEPHEGFVIQVFSSHDEPQARRVLAQLEAASLPAYHSPVEVEGKTMHRVRIGPYPERSKAEGVAKQVNTRFKLDTWVTSAAN